MAKVRIHEIAKELGSSSKKILEKAKELGFAVTTVSSAVSQEDAEKLYIYARSGIIPDNAPVKKSTPKKDPKSEIEAKKNIKEESKSSIADTKKIKNEPKESPKDEPKEQTLGNSSLNKRRGLVIVKKKKDEQPKEQKPSQSIINNKALESMFGSSDESLKKKKKDKKQFHATKKESSSKLDLMGLSEFGDDIVIDDENVVILPDLTLKPIEVERQQTIKKPLNVYKQSQNSGFNLDGGIQRSSRKKHKKLPKDNQNESVTSVHIPKEIRVYEFADKIKKSPSEIIGKLFMLGKMTTKNDFLEEDEIEILGAEFGIEINIVDTQEEFDYVKAYEGEDDQHSEPRAPVVTIMGHVDHGKTSLLDYIQNSRVASGEAGGITQHVGAYMVEKNGKNITFIDTPGHEAFTAMRARGASVTDIVIIVVAADDGVKPQTKEAISHAKAAGVPIIIAINKMDKESANPDLVKTGLAELDIMPTEWGGSYEFVPVSAKTGMGIEDLLEIVLLQAEILELKANPNREAKATIIESSLQKGRGPVATVIVENGTLKVGDTIVAGVAYGKVRALSDDKGRSLKAIKPGECGVLIGLSEVPEAGETLISVKSDKEAREYAHKKYEYLRQKELSKSTKVTIDELSAKIAEGELKNLPVIIKADVQGSLEAIKASLEKLRNDEIKVSIIHSGVGGITQSDISLASASQNCVILGFNIRPTGDIKEKAKEKAVEIKTYNVIYNLLDDVKALLSGLMSPVITEEDLGQAVIRQVINVPKVGQIAGCMVTEGIISRGAKIRVIRDGVVVFEGNISSLKRFKDDAKEVAKGYECGVGIEGYNDMREGDYIESYKEVENKAEI
ncbi:translation initiation factor IF-2 [Campylobacter lanienae]|uniref:translation initiation factor IF-2 n=1 Tax=Campylobacter lanienae TaxID=75658 RepID=UPI00242A3C7C|nr:translation initiation factor IF-2 [Campylobacter lanienae]MCI5539660.1 translation initiation factor IF-2 [Campylobacter lanienae]MDD7514916.1 translation initiation factor IF-2 [Campylobacter lanienae]MDY5519253.1 translation initiation factor IF-2 [Campylobacter lanienae]